MKTKKFWMMGIAIAVVCALSCVLAACNGFGADDVNGAYDPYANSAADGNLNVSLDEVKAMLGNISSATVDEEGNLIFELKDHTKVNVGKFDGIDVEAGKDGQDGQDGVSIKTVSINEEGELVIEFSNGNISTLASIVGAQGEQGEKGEQGVGIKNIAEGSHANGKTYYTITYTDGHTNVISIQDGRDGVSIKNIYINAQGQFVVNYTDDTTEIITAEQYTLEENTAWYKDYSQSVYYIATAEDFAGFAKKVYNGISFKNQTIKLTADIDLSSVKWAAIGNQKSNFKFQGTLDGNGHSIIGLNFSDSSLAYAGLFQQTDGATIKNLTLTNVNISDNSATVGALVGKAINTKFENVRTGGNMAIALGGGIAGEAVNSTFENCANGIDISVSLSGAQKVVIGGIVGKVSATTFVNSANNADINLNLACLPTSALVGQIIGTSEDTVEFGTCTANGFVIVSSKADAEALQNSNIVGQDRHGNAVKVFNSNEDKAVFGSAK